MKKFYTLAVIAAMFSNAAIAQDKPQLPNADFEGSWATCKPWTSNNDTKTIGQNPDSWTISNVSGFKVPILGYMGATQVGEKAEGYDSASSVKVYNNNNPIVTSQIVPGYFTLGTTWSTANTKAENADGGTFGGIQFTGRPESITFMYKRTLGEAKPEEPATVVAYLWKGTFEQKDVPGNIGDSPKKVNMIDRDRNILDMETAQGGEVSQKGTLIGKINYQISGDAAEWTELTIPFKYVSEETPEKFNIIFCAGDYFSSAPGKDNALYIDNVKLNYPVNVDATDTYTGLLKVQLGEDDPSEINDQEVFMDKMDNGTYRLRLENFGADDANPEGMGSIIVNNVTITDNNVSGHADGISLLGGSIIATADVTGTLIGNDLSLVINVVWTDQPDVPITVTFNGKKDSAGIVGIESDDNAPAEYYNLNGVRVNGNNMTPGIYICRQGSKVTKVLVK